MEKMIRLNNNERMEMGRKGRQKIMNEFDLKLVINEYMQVIKEIVN